MAAEATRCDEGRIGWIHATREGGPPPLVQPASRTDVRRRGGQRGDGMKKREDIMRGYDGVADDAKALLGSIVLVWLAMRLLFGIAL